MSIGKKKLITKEGLLKLQKELDERTHKIRTEIADKLESAKGIGDLSENSAYHAALEEYQMNETKINELKDLVANLDIAPDRSGDTTVDIGDKVIIEDTQSKEQFTYTIVGQGEGDPSSGQISVNSVIGAALVHKHVGESISVKLQKGVKKYIINDIS